MNPEELKVVMRAESRRQSIRALKIVGLLALFALGLIALNIWLSSM